MTLTDPNTNAEAVIAAATRAAEPVELDLDTVYSVARADGQVETIDTKAIADRYAETPRRAKGTARLTTVPSFVSYVKELAPDAPLFADVDNRTVQAVFNGTTCEGPGHGDHRAVFTAKHTPSWTRWAAIHGKPLDQVTFADHVQDCIGDVVSPDGAELLEIAGSFQAKTAVDFKESIALQSGERKLVYEETIAAKAGQKGDIEVPEFLTLALAVFEGEDRQEVAARLRFRITQQGLRVIVVLDRPEEIVRDHFDALVQGVAAGLDTEVWHGIPAA